MDFVMFMAHFRILDLGLPRAAYPIAYHGHSYIDAQGGNSARAAAAHSYCSLGGMKAAMKGGHGHKLMVGLALSNADVPSIVSN